MHEDLERKDRRDRLATGTSWTPRGRPSAVSPRASRTRCAARTSREYTPHVDTGDFVVVVNAEKIAVTGKKLDEKIYYRHSGYPGGLKERPLREQLDRRPDRRAAQGGQGHAAAQPPRARSRLTEAEDLRRPRASARGAGSQAARSDMSCMQPERAQYQGTGKRKTSVARVILRPGDGTTWFNGRTIEDYFPRPDAPRAGAGAAEGRRRRGDLRHPRPRARRRAERPGGRGPPRHRPGARRGRSGAAHAAQARRLPHARRADRRAQEGRPAQGAQGAAVLQALVVAPATSELTGSAASSAKPDARARRAARPRRDPLVGGGARLRGPRHARFRARSSRRRSRAGSCPQEADAVLAGVLPTPAVALLRARPRRRHLRLAQPARVQRRQVLRPRRRKADRRGRGGDRGAPRRARRSATRPGERDHVGVATDSYLEHVVERFGSTSPACASRSTARTAPTPGSRQTCFERLGAQADAIGAEPDGTNINVGCGATDLPLLQQTVTRQALDLGVAFDGDGDRMLAVDAQATASTETRSSRSWRLHLGVDLVAVTVMANLGFHRLTGRGARHPRGHDRRRRPLRARGAARARAACSAASSPGTSSTCVITSPATGSPRRCCSAARSRAGRWQRPPPSCRAIRRRTRMSASGTKELPRADRPAEVERTEPASSAARGRVLVRPSGTEPVIRVLAEAETEEEAEKLCGTIVGSRSTRARLIDADPHAGLGRAAGTLSRS